MMHQDDVRERYEATSRRCSKPASNLTRRSSTPPTTTRNGAACKPASRCWPSGLRSTAIDGRHRRQRHGHHAGTARRPASSCHVTRPSSASTTSTRRRSCARRCRPCGRTSASLGSLAAGCCSTSWPGKDVADGHLRIADRLRSSRVVRVHQHDRRDDARPAVTGAPRPCSPALAGRATRSHADRRRRRAWPRGDGGRGRDVLAHTPSRPPLRARPGPAEAELRATPRSALPPQPAQSDRAGRHGGGAASSAVTLSPSRRRTTCDRRAGYPTGSSG